MLSLNIKGFESLILNSYLKRCDNSKGGDNSNDNGKDCGFKTFEFLDLNEEGAVVISAF